MQLHEKALEEELKARKRLEIIIERQKVDSKKYNEAIKAMKEEIEGMRSDFLKR